MNETNATEFYEGEKSPVLDVFADLEKYVSCSFLGVVVILGLTGNILCLRYLTGKRLRKKSYSIYFIGFAIADNVTLVGTGLPILLEWAFHESWRANSGVEICITFHCILEFSENLSSLLMVAVATDRYIAVVYPLHRPVMCTTRRALLTSISLAIMSVVLTVPDIILLAMGLESLDCRVAPEGVLDLIEKNRFILFSLVIPVLVTIFLNFKVLTAISKAKKKRDNYLEAAGVSLAMSSGQLRITVALVTVTIVSAFLLLPVIAIEIGEFFLLKAAKTNRETKDILTNATCASHLIEVLNITINFFTLVGFTGTGCRCHCTCRCQDVICCTEKEYQAERSPNPIAVLNSRGESRTGMSPFQRTQIVRTVI